MWARLFVACCRKSAAPGPIWLYGQCMSCPLHAPPLPTPMPKQGHPWCRHRCQQEPSVLHRQKKVWSGPRGQRPLRALHCSHHNPCPALIRAGGQWVKQIFLLLPLPYHHPMHHCTQPPKFQKKRKFVRHPSPPWGQWMPQISMLFHNKFCPWFWARVQKNFQAKEVIGLSGNANFCVFLKKCKK